MSTEPSTTLQRRRELKRLSKPQLIDRVVTLEADIAAAATRLEHAAGKIWDIS